MVPDISRFSLQMSSLHEDTKNNVGPRFQNLKNDDREIQILLNGEHTFKTHELVLRAYSDVYRVQKKINPIITISEPTLSKKATALMVNYLYRGKVAANTANIVELCFLANFFKISVIMEKLEKFMKSMKLSVLKSTTSPEQSKRTVPIIQHEKPSKQRKYQTFPRGFVPIGEPPKNAVLTPITKISLASIDASTTNSTPNGSVLFSVTKERRIKQEQEETTGKKDKYEEQIKKNGDQSRKVSGIFDDINLLKTSIPSAKTASRAVKIERRSKNRVKGNKKSRKKLADRRVLLQEGDNCLCQIIYCCQGYECYKFVQEFESNRNSRSGSDKKVTYVATATLPVLLNYDEFHYEIDPKTPTIGTGKSDCSSTKKESKIETSEKNKPKKNNDSSVSPVDISSFTNISKRR
uniref:BTB domain-containing protein n=1 Tax=Rhabditophanes sp. KR3021 TaxID=114890 RepID=A0AC35UHY8_9BILA